MKRLALALACLVLPVAGIAGQAPAPSHETTSEVPALSAMHEVIMPLWHEAWPAKDTAAMARILPDIEKHVKAVSGAKLPGILRDKQAAWDAGVKQLQAGAEAYREAVEKKDSDALLKAAERLHMDYEKLVRVVRPVTPEIDAFHQALYVLFHHDLENFSLPAVTEHVQALKAKADALNAAVLPDRLKAKSPAYEAARARLSKSVDALVAAVGAKNQATIKVAVERVHSDYEALDDVFK